MKKSKISVLVVADYQPWRDFVCSELHKRPGFKTVGRWHVLGSILGWHLLEGDDATLLARHVAEWAEVIELEVNPVIEDGG
ncbi:MAG TPA: DUF3303 family protein [Terriglobales bacterium]|nr:DUF3303 family protein [Terriglobales bacterium]